MNKRRNEKVKKEKFTKQDHIKYWINTANKDWTAIKKMIGCRSYIHALFFMHLVLEKLLKAHWVKDNIGNHPPKTHDLIWLIKQIKHQITDKEIGFLREMNIFQLEGRYPKYIQNLYAMYKQTQTYAIFTTVNQLRKCLLEKLR